jgi:hypothetical protein
MPNPFHHSFPSSLGVFYREIKTNVLRQFKEWDYVGVPILEHLEPYTSPFAKECRAFARLDSMGENGTWAVKRHRWMKLSDEQLQPVHGEDYITPWTVVKDYIPGPVQLSDTPEIHRKLEIAQRAVIHPDDLKPRNYRGSFLVDLGNVRTCPYVKELWSDRVFERVFKRYDRVIGRWEIDDSDGSVVQGGTNERRRQAKGNR